MFWVAEYWDGNAVPQYDPFTQTENPFSQVDHKKVKRFWWLPVTPDMTEMFPGIRYNQLLTRHGVDLNGSKGFVARRVQMKMTRGLEPALVVKCYVIGIEGGPRQEIYPDGSVINKDWPNGIGETQDILHH
jgi:hypothetical protein